MEEKKKRWRPSLKEYRELEALVRLTKNERDYYKEAYTAESKEAEDMRNELSLQRASVTKLADELHATEGALATVKNTLRETIDEYESRLDRLMNRGFFARMLNLGIDDMDDLDI